MDTSPHTGTTAERSFRIYNAKVLGIALREARRSAGLTQLEMADRIGVDRSYLSEMENGKETEQLRRLFQILRELDIKMLLQSELW
ncbi:helix-turn-helix domain-containing protein [Ferrimicrobium sp.]|uniref:helix-turn-helix domain-containing protein n=1 Tax=Ferrimicrobium sp. TaxID=2926050 RepID=UPI00260681A0|nr:helix-turn-helix domain-containing protein [Ferrimicrobium sp.]